MLFFCKEKTFLKDGFLFDYCIDNLQTHLLL